MIQMAEREVFQPNRGWSPVRRADMVDQMPDRLNSCQPEEISITKVSRGERI